MPCQWNFFLCFFNPFRQFIQISINLCIDVLFGGIKRKADDNPENDEIDIPELVYIELGSGRDSIRIIELTGYPVGVSSDWWPQVKVDDLELWTLQQSSIKDMLLNSCEATEVEVIPECSNAQFSFDQPGTPPNSRFINLSFDLTENDVVRPYHIDSAIRSWAGHQISADGYGIIDDDD